MRKLAVLDYDSTLMDGEIIEIVFESFYDDIIKHIHGYTKVITEEMKKKFLGLCGREVENDQRFDFFDNLLKKTEYLNGLKYTDLVNFCRDPSKVRYIPGAKEFIRELKERKYTVVVMSGGIKEAVLRTIEDLGVDAVFANTLETSKLGVLTGRISGPMMFPESKGETVRSLQQILGIGPENTLVVGDGINDASMFKHADYRVAFCASDALLQKGNPNVVIKQKNLSLITDELLKINNYF